MWTLLPPKGKSVTGQLVDYSSGWARDGRRPWGRVNAGNYFHCGEIIADMDARATRHRTRRSNPLRHRQGMNYPSDKLDTSRGIGGVEIAPNPLPPGGGGSALLTFISFEPADASFVAEIPVTMNGQELTTVTVTGPLGGGGQVTERVVNFDVPTGVGSVEISIPSTTGAVSDTVGVAEGDPPPNGGGENGENGDKPPGGRLPSTPAILAGLAAVGYVVLR